MKIEYDPDKDAINREKHGVSLAFGEQVFGSDDSLTFSSTRPIDGEDRYKAVAHVDGKLWTAVFVRREAAVRFISVRRSNDGERRLHDRA